MHREEILSLLRLYKQSAADKYGILEIGVFGSVARDEHTDAGDLDICIKTREPDAFALVHIKEEIEQLSSRHVDIVRVRERMNPYLKERIRREAVYV